MVAVESRLITLAADLKALIDELRPQRLAVEKRYTR